MGSSDFRCAQRRDNRLRTSGFSNKSPDATLPICTTRSVADFSRGSIANVISNNAGYGFEGILEESTLDQLRQQFDTNVFGAIAIS